MQKFDFTYDKENDDLFLYNPKSRSKGSVELGDIIFDYNNKKEFVGLQIMNATKILREMVPDENKDLVKNILRNLKECKIDVKIKNKLLIIRVYLFSDIKEISPIISVPSIRETSPALAYT